MYLNAKSSKNLSIAILGLTLTWDVFKYYMVTEKQDYITFNFNMRCI